MNPRLHPISRAPRRADAGFSLVEVALAVAIAAVGIITCLGLLPEGLEMSRKTGVMAIHSNILDQIIQDIENVSNWRTVKQNYKPPPGFPNPGRAANTDERIRLFDYQGTPLLPGTGGDNRENVAFVAQVDFDEICILPGDAEDQNFLARVIIRIANSPDPGFNFENPPPGAVVPYYHLVSKTR